MSDIRLYNREQALAAIPARDVEIYDALSSDMISSISNAICFELFKLAITKAYIASRYTAPEGSEMTTIITETSKFAKARLGSIRVKEVDIAFTRGLTKEYGEYHGLSFITFIDFLKGYMKESSRLALMAPVDEIKEPTSEEKFQIASYNALKSFSDYKKGEDIHLVAPAVYRFLNRLKIIQYNDEERSEFLDFAEKAVILQEKEKASKTNDRNMRRAILSALQRPETLEQKIIFQAQRLGLYAYFQSAIMDDMDLRKVILEYKEKLF